MITRLIMLTAFLCSIKVFAAGANTSQPSMCEQYLTAKPYVSAEKAADLCQIYPQGTLGCAMDLIDRDESPAFADALEYCLNPLDTGPGN